MRKLCTGLALLACSLLSNVSVASTAEEPGTFARLQALSPDQAEMQAREWLQSQRPLTPTDQKELDRLWSTKEKTVLDRVIGTFALAQPEAQSLLERAADPDSPAPTSLPSLLTDKKQSRFFRANLGLAYAERLSLRRIYEQSLDVLSGFSPKDVVDPSAYLFHKAVAEHALLKKREALRSLAQLLDDVLDAPERYRNVGAIMVFDITRWGGTDLGSELDHVRRLMQQVERRLDLSRGGKKTQGIQEEVVKRLSDIIARLEAETDGPGTPRPPGPGKPQPPHPGPRKPGAIPDPRNPQDYPVGGTTNTPGQVDPVQMENLVKQWGKLPPRERARAMRELTRGYPPKYREVIEEYFRRLSRAGR